MTKQCGFALLLMLNQGSCDPFYDEGSRFASQIADFAMKFRGSAESTAVFSYSPRYGTNQRVHYAIGRIRWCPKPPCDNQGAAAAIVERGVSGTGYKIATAASVPEPLQIDKQGEPVRVYMRKENGDVQIVALK